MNHENYDVPNEQGLVGKRRITDPNVNIRNIFVRASSHLRYDSRLTTEIVRYNDHFINKNEEHVKFFGGNLTGVHVVRFTPMDKNNFVVGILDYDESEIRKQIVKLPTVDESWVRGTDIMNLSCLWLCHCFERSDLSPKDKEKAQMAVLRAMHLKLLSSLLFHFFRFPVNEQIALAVYSQLSKKYAIKQYGSWGKVIEERCRDIISMNSIHRQTIEKFDDDAAIQYMITDIQGRLRSMMRNIYSVMNTVRAEDQRMLSSSGMVEVDGQQVIRDLSRDIHSFIRYTVGVIPEQRAFVKPELVRIITAEVKSAPEQSVLDALNAMSAMSRNQRPNNYRKEKDPYNYVSPKGMETMVNEILIHAMDQLSKDRALLAKKDYRPLLSKMRSLYMASRSSDPAILKVREMSEIMVAASINSRNGALIASVKTACCLYIILRTLTKDHYG